MELEITLSKTSQTQKDKYHVLSYVWNLEQTIKYDMNFEEGLSIKRKGGGG